MIPSDTQSSVFNADQFCAQLAERPGVYRMLNADGQVIYVGKAKNLKKRVSSYFQRNEQSIKTQSMVAQIAAIEVSITETEKEALLLENNLIKAIRPRYNIVLRDDKSYPYIFINSDHPYPRLAFHRGSRRAAGRYFGPYPSASAVRQTLNILQKLFMLRQCEDSFFNNRSRPCLQYQIKRCTAPCMGYIDEVQYQDDIHLAELFLQGKSHQLIERLAQQMEQCSQALQYEQAAKLRDQIQTLNRIEEKQYISADAGNIDIVACVSSGGTSCIQVFFVRNGHNLGNKAFYPRHNENTSREEVLHAFLCQFYIHARGVEGAGAASDSLGADVSRLPDEIIVNLALPERELLQNTFSDLAGRRLRLSHQVRSERAKWLQIAIKNAQTSLAQRLSSQASIVERFESLQDALSFADEIQRIECFDISHTMGEATVASCVVMGREGPLKSDYRRFNIKDITPGDDYAAMRQALTRRYTRLKRGEGSLPDILLIDGGKGQVREAKQVLDELQIDSVTIIGVAKGPSRKAGWETLFYSDDRQGFSLAPESSALHLIQQVRDEAHRFAITAHRNRRSRARNVSTLENIEGLGPKRRQALLTRFGGLQQVQQASVDELQKVSGINLQLAQRIYDYFRD